MKQEKFNHDLHTWASAFTESNKEGSPLAETKELKNNLQGTKQPKKYFYSFPSFKHWYAFNRSRVLN